jgi:hypothetical protein
MVAKINPLVGGAEAGDLGVGVDCRQPTPELRATPPKTSPEEIQAGIKLIGKIQLVRTNPKVPF